LRVYLAIEGRNLCKVKLIADAIKEFGSQRRISGALEDSILELPAVRVFERDLAGPQDELS